MAALMAALLLLPLLATATAPRYTPHPGDFCAANASPAGPFYIGKDSFAACEARCVATNCACFDVASTPKPVCRLTDVSTAVRASAEHFSAYTDPTPRHPPSTKGGRSVYGCQGNHSTHPFCNTSLTPGARAELLVGLLTPAEKGALLTARTTAQSNAIPRLGVPLFCWGQNAAQGYLQTGLPSTGGGLTDFPWPVGIGATWNLSAVAAMASVFATEARSVFNQGNVSGSEFSCPGSVVLWGPTINLQRDPRWGRNGEAPSECPLLSGLYGAAYAAGAQRSAADPRYLKTIVTLKHFGAYSVDHYDNGTVSVARESFNATVSDFDLYDSYAPLFETAIRGTAPGVPPREVAPQASPDPSPSPNPSPSGVSPELDGALGVMCSYPAINGVPACASRLLQTELLRGNWSFEGYVVGDSDTIQYANTRHHYINSPAAAVHATLSAGTDLESWCNGGNPRPNYYRDVIPEMLRNGSLDVGLVDQSVLRLLTLRFRTGVFDDPDDQPFARISPKDRGTPQHAATALDTARQSVTLLVNRGGTLPVVPGRHVAVIGPYSKQWSVSDEVEQLNVGGTTTVTQGCAVNGDDRSGFAAALAAAAAADVVLLALGADQSLEHESLDRLTITLPRIQSALALAVLQARQTPTRVVVNLFNLGQVATEELLPGPNATNGGVDALLMSYWPRSGTPVAEALFGALNPGGRLPYTVYPNNYTAAVDFLNMSFVAGPGRTYRYYTGTPLFPFGYGLGYSNFTLRGHWQQPGPTAETPQGTEPCTPPPAGPAGVALAAQRYNVTVTNTGTRAGTETVQLYLVPPLRLPAGWRAPVPFRRLLDFRKVALAAGASVQVEFVVQPEQFKLVDHAGRRVQVAGPFGLQFTNGNDQTVCASFPPSSP